MRDVLLALIPGTLAMIYFFGWGVLFNVIFSCGFALASEALVLKLRRRAVLPVLKDNSALVSGFLLALTLPPFTPWWLPAIGASFAMIFAKHLYGGLGFNLFNPAMIGYVVLLISFPVEMTRWPIPRSSFMQETLDLGETLNILFFNIAPQPGWDAITGATPLDIMRTRLNNMETISEIKAHPLFGDFGGRGWEWLGNWFFLGGLWLLYRRIITWHIPVAMLGSLLLLAFFFYQLDPDTYPSPGFHLFSGGMILGAFFIATDPVSSCTSNKGKLIFGLGVGILTYIIRNAGGYPDGVAFAVLLMNTAAPLIDRYTKPRVYGKT